MDNFIPDILRVIQNLEIERCKAMVQKEVNVLNKLLGEDLIYGHSSGKLDTKAEFISLMTAGSLTYLAIEPRLDRIVPLAPGTFVASGWLKTSAEYHGVTMSLSGRYMVVWRQKDDRWQLLALQASNS